MTTLKEYGARYTNWMEATEAKNPLTIQKEAGAIKGWTEAFPEVALNAFTRAHVNDYAVNRRRQGVSNRTVNLDVIALGNLLRFAKSEGALSGPLATDDWRPLRYKPAKRPLLAPETLERLCTAALAGDVENGQFLADFIRFCAYSGARRQAALSCRWDQVDWTNRQLTLYTKFDKTIVVDFNPKLEAVLTEMHARKTGEWLFPSPAESSTVGHVANPQRVVEKVAARVGLTDFRLHDLRHFFASHAVMSGVDIRTVSEWMGHSDGGALIGRTYSHLNPGHRRESAKKVTFA